MRNSLTFNVTSFTTTVSYELLFLLCNIFNDLNHKISKIFPPNSDRFLRKDIFRSFVDFYRVLIQHMAPASLIYDIRHPLVK